AAPHPELDGRCPDAAGSRLEQPRPIPPHRAGGAQPGRDRVGRRRGARNAVERFRQGASRAGARDDTGRRHRAHTSQTQAGRTGIRPPVLAPVRLPALKRLVLVILLGAPIALAGCEAVTGSPSINQVSGWVDNDCTASPTLKEVPCTVHLILHNG